MWITDATRRIRAEALFTAVPLTIVNGVAFYGQFGYLRYHESLPIPVAVIIGSGLESIALYLAYMAHKALTAGDSSLRLRLGAIMFGCIAGFMNATHYETHGRFTFLSIVTGLMSVSSPVLWGIYSRRQSRDKLISSGAIEPGAIRLGANRWIWHPRRSFTVYRDTAWSGERDVQTAISSYHEPKIIPEDIPDNASPAIDAPTVTADSERDRERDSAGPQTVTSKPQSKAQTVTEALLILGPDASAPAVCEHLSARGVTVTPEYVRQIKSRTARQAVSQARDSIRALPAGESDRDLAG
jgi:hypothetical protein